MTVVFNIAEAKSKLSELVARAEAGEEVIIARAGKPAVVLHPAPQPSRRLGGWSHLGVMEDPDIFFRPDPDLEAAADGPIFPDVAPPET